MINHHITMKLQYNIYNGSSQYETFRNCTVIENQIIGFINKANVNL